MPTSTNAQLGGSRREGKQRLEHISHLLGGLMILYDISPDTVRRPGAMALNILN